MVADIKKNAFKKIYLYLEKRKVSKILEELNIENYHINDDLSVDVNGSVNISEENITKIPVQFNFINGDFDCGYNLLSTLKGVPKNISGNFICCNNNLFDMEYSPEVVGGSCDYSNNNITSLLNSPKNIGTYLNVYKNNLLSLKNNIEELNNIIISDKYNYPINLTLKELNSIENIVDHPLLQKNKNRQMKLS